MAGKTGMNQPEITLNLWYVRDEEGFIYSLRARAYIGRGSEEENLTALLESALYDYLIARVFSIPEQFHIEGNPVFHVGALDYLDSPVALFEEAIKILQAELPSQTSLNIPASPLVCVTPLFGDDNGNIYPKINQTTHIP
jgi:hypothetical protein